MLQRFASPRQRTGCLIANPLSERGDKTCPALFAGLVAAAVALALPEIEGRGDSCRVADAPFGRARPGRGSLLPNWPALVPHLNRKFGVLLEPALNRLLRCSSQVPSAGRLDLLDNLT